MALATGARLRSVTEQAVIAIRWSGTLIAAIRILVAERRRAWRVA